ncbi:MAG: ribonuclease III [Elainellaceae cyanobacterium]
MSFSDLRRYKQLQQFVQKLGLDDSTAVNWSLLHQSLTHATASAHANYEKLEFVGDAVIRLAAAEFLYETYPDATEGELSAIRSVLVSDRILYEIAECYGLERYLLIGSSAVSNRAGRQTRLAAAFEAVLAALYLSTHTLELICPWLNSHLQHYTETIRQDPTFHNYKGALQAWTQAHWQTLPDYRVTEIGQTYGDMERFVAEVWFQGKSWGQGKGPSKKAAEQAAAQAAFQTLQQTTENTTHTHEG